VWNTHETEWFFTDSRAKRATAMAEEYFRKKIEKALCGSGNWRDIKRFSVAPSSDERARLADVVFDQTDSERSFVLGWYQDGISSVEVKRSRNEVKWNASIAIIDKMGWSKDEYGPISPLLDEIVFPFIEAYHD
jgi:hypothetical protein